MDFRFTTEYPQSRADEIVDYLTGPRLWIPRRDYPDLLGWTQKVHDELRGEIKRAMVALSGDEIVGVTVFQRHKLDIRALEIKNLTVRPDVRGRLFASFMLRNVETEAWREFSSDYVVADAKTNNWPVRRFLLSQGYKIVGRTDLYGLGTGEDNIYRKELDYLKIRFPRKN